MAADRSRVPPAVRPRSGDRRPLPPTGFSSCSHPQPSPPVVPRCAAAAEAHVGAPDTVVADAQQSLRRTMSLDKVQPGASFRLPPSVRKGTIRAQLVDSTPPRHLHMRQHRVEETDGRRAGSERLSAGTRLTWSSREAIQDGGEWRTGRSRVAPART